MGPFAPLGPRVAAPEEGLGAAPFATTLPGAGGCTTMGSAELSSSARAGMRSRSDRLDGLALVGTLEAYSERRADYVRTIRRIITGNRLTSFDDVRLGKNAPPVVRGPRI